jgi:hypothetical protein
LSLAGKLFIVSSLIDLFLAFDPLNILPQSHGCWMAVHEAASFPRSTLRLENIFCISGDIYSDICKFSPSKVINPGS